MDLRIQYAQTEDGVSIAHSSLGRGAPLVHLPNFPFSHVQLEWQLPGWRRWYEHLAQNRMLVRYDCRGSGLSDRDVTDYSLDALVLDLEAVVHRLGLERLALLGPLSSGAVAIAYAARRPEKVSRLVLWCSYARGSDYYRSAQVQALRALRDKDWNTYTETTAHAFLGWSAGDEAHRFAAYMRECSTPEAVQAAWQAQTEHDVMDLLPQVRSPTLVLHRRQFSVLDVDIARGLASRIPNARLVVLEGASAAPWADLGPVITAINEFLEEDEAAPDELPERMAVLLFTDIAESTALTEQLGDAAFRAKARELDAALRSIIRECGGTAVEGKVLGDGVMAVFTSARQAIDCALRCESAARPLGLQLHLGIHAGDVIREGTNVYGGAVNIAARVASTSVPGEILVSDIVRGLARTSAGVAFDDRGKQKLKGIGEPQRLFAVRRED